MASALLKVSGPDSRGVRSVRHTFHQSNEGITTLSSSCTLVSLEDRVIVTSASTIYPFLSKTEVSNSLIPGTKLEVSFSQGSRPIPSPALSTSAQPSGIECTLEASFLNVFLLPEAEQMLNRMSSPIGGGKWYTGWRNPAASTPLPPTGPFPLPLPATPRSPSASSSSSFARFQQPPVVPSPSCSSSSASGNGRDSFAFSFSLSNCAGGEEGEQQPHQQELNAEPTSGTSPSSGPMPPAVDPYVWCLSPAAFAVLHIPSTLPDWLIAEISSGPYYCQSSADICGDVPVVPRSHIKRGQNITVISSPFGILSPIFRNSLCKGVVSNCFCASSFSSSSAIISPPPPPAMTSAPLLMLDCRVFPGSEGAPVFAEDGRLLAIMSNPMKRSDSAFELSFAVPLDCIINHLRNPQGGSPSPSQMQASARRSSSSSSSSSSEDQQQQQQQQQLSQSPVSSPSHPQALRSLVEVSVGNTWASGILLSSDGYILTNAHVLRSYMTRPSSSSSMQQQQFPRRSSSFSSSPSSASLLTPASPQSPSLLSPSSAASIPTPLVVSAPIYVTFHSPANVMEERTQCMADVVYYSNGPLDLALLKIRSTIPSFAKPVDLHLLNDGDLNLHHPMQGQDVNVLGFAVFGPHTGVRASVTRGTLSRIVGESEILAHAGLPSPSSPAHSLSSPSSFSTSRLSSRGSRQMLLDTPVLLQSTAAVHHGNSGGLLTCAKTGRMLGIICSNARQQGGSIIPNLNFAIPVAQLLPLLGFLRSGEALTLSQLDRPSEAVGMAWSLQMPKKPNVSPKEQQSKFLQFLQQAQQQQQQQSQSPSALRSSPLSPRL